MTWHDASRAEASFLPPKEESCLLSVVLPVHGCAESLEELHSRLSAVIDRTKLPGEILFVDDACRAGSDEMLRSLAAQDPRVGLLTFNVNVGQHRAVLAGLAHCRGERVVIMDADLQDPPEAIPLLLGTLDEGFAAVFAGRRGIYESTVRTASARLFKAILHALTGTPRDGGMFVAVTREMAGRLLSMHAPRPYVVAMIGCAGLPIHSVPVARALRARGSSAYTSWRRLRTALSALVWACYWRGRSWKPAAPPRGARGELLPGRKS